MPRVIELEANRLGAISFSRHAGQLKGWKVVAWGALKPRIDVFEADGKVRTGLICRNNPVNMIDPSGLTWGTNLGFLWDFLTGRGSRNRNYDPCSTESREMQNSPGANALRDAFNEGGGEDVLGFNYGTGQAAWDTLLNPSTADWSSTGAQVGGFGGASAVNNGNGTVTFTIPNQAGTQSFFYHAVSNRSGTTGPGRTITQTFQWTEPVR
jgi:hypothetical protein